MAVICVSEITVKLAEGAPAPNATLVAPVKPVPVMVTVVPPAIGPELGEIDVTTGAGRSTNVNRSAETAADLPPAVVTKTFFTPTGSGGDCAVIVVSECTVN
jgi:hypothetical protein